MEQYRITQLDGLEIYRIEVLTKRRFGGDRWEPYRKEHLQRCISYGDYQSSWEPVWFNNLPQARAFLAELQEAATEKHNRSLNRWHEVD